ncbi:CCA tRNA nucleotidyltransferase [Croceicoccus naphthovorans]|uniref:Polynucleotide adenylyltransferase n=1 Tax=Croceicoccus naphthovorans TaxID=1348774 RepID=A0A0G3XG67_9SPHN|nr:CCA tRNA nucleotidyltransferase [Croceicoccus naphthovorans]AKM10187.1 polynucleotide adenylyltransferase [Croceicoccus naphthovorans]MBB3990575.1 poly(A) polymerase [Croceicoccus naphthovorans]
MVPISQAEWVHRKDIAALVAALGADECRYVGGCVRDALMGHEAHDVDIATRHHPDRVVAILKDAGIRTVPTGLEHGTVTAVLDGGPVEITTLRCDVETDGRRATVRFASEWKDDAARRDFTINALYLHPTTLDISDYFGGLDDLDDRRVRFIGDARQRIAEDHLRILRYFRFHARFGSEPPDAEAIAACRELAATLKGLSRERVGWELQNLLALPDPAPTVARMADLGVLKVVLPEAGAVQIDRLARLISAEREGRIAPDPIRRLAALLPPDPALAEQVASRLRLSNAQKKRIKLATMRNDADAVNPRGLAYREGLEVARDRLLLLGEPVNTIANWELPALPIKGGDIVAAGVGAGPDVAKVLRAVETRWIANGFPDEAQTRAFMAEEIANLG